MSYRLSDIKYETRSFFVLSVGDRGFEIYKTGPTAAVRVGRVGNGELLGLKRAIQETNRRQALADAEHDAAAAKATGKG